MASSTLGIGCRGNNSVVVDHLGKWSIENRCNNLTGARPWSVVIGDQRRSIGRKGRISTTTAMATMTAASLEPFWKYGGGKKYQGRRNDAVDAYERLDEWMRDSVVDIVKNLREAPLLVQVYPKEKGSGGETTTLRTEKKAVVDDWPVVMEKWEMGETPLPEGVILVEELAAEGEKEGEEGRERTTKAWGIVVQGRGAGSGPVCYLLKTSRVGAGQGMGPCSTHFCLVRVKSFRETLKSQLKNCWLLQSQ